MTHHHPVAPAADTAPAARVLSPRRKTTAAHSISELAREQLEHFGIDPDGETGRPLARLAERLYEAHTEVEEVWETTLRRLATLERHERVAHFNAKKFLCFQLAKLLDLMQNPLRRSYQSLDYGRDTALAKGPFPLFDNVTALFSATPVITRTATYIYACTEWIDDAFQGRELMLEIYSRLLNPTSICLANHIVDVEAGRHAPEYMAWNFNSGMAAIDAVLSHLLGYRDVVLSSRNIYGGAYQLLNDWFGKPSNLNVAVEWFDGYTVEAFAKRLAEVRELYLDRLNEGRRVYVYLESPCNPHGYFLDVPAICRLAHANGLTVILDSTVGTPFLNRPLQRDDPAERPDFVIHSYTKDIVGGGNTTAGVVIGRAVDMFIPKGEVVGERSWEHTLFWNVYYVKGAFLDSDKAFEVLSGMKTLELRMLRKCANTLTLARWLGEHPAIGVHCSALPRSSNYHVASAQSYLGLPAPLFTIDFENAGLDRMTFERFFDNLSPMYGHQVSLGQSNTVILCPALTSHSELDPSALKRAGIMPTTIRIAVGDESPRELIADFLEAVRLAIDPVHPGFSAGFPSDDRVDEMVDATYVDVQTRYAASQPRFAQCRK